MSCETLLYDKCSNGHPLRYKCRNGIPNVCVKCERDRKAAERKAKEDFSLQEKRDREQREHDKKMAEIEAEIALEREKIRDAQLAQDRHNQLLQKQRDREDAATLAAQATASASPVTAPTPSTSSPSVAQAVFSAVRNLVSPTSAPSSTPPANANITDTTSAATPVSTATDTNANSRPPARTKTPPRSEARDEWERQKLVEGASNSAIDAIMEMAGLEKVKSTVLDIKDTVDTAKRQGIPLSKKRYNLSCLGNPGTGM